MMEKILIILTAACFFLSAEAQTVKIENGISHSEITEGDEKKRCNSNGYYASLGVDYFEHNHFFLSSRIAYFKAGTYAVNHDIGGNATYLEYKTDNVQFATLINAKNTFGHFVIHAGLGPELIYIAPRHVPEELYALPLSTEKYSFGITGSFGIFTDIDRYRIGINFSCSDNFKTRPDIKNYILSFSIGYIF
jgi:hypothetical protein